MFERVSAEESAALEALACKVRNELAAAGLPVIAPGLDPALTGGAEVDIDDGADAAGGVYVAWQPSSRLRACASRAFRLKQLNEPVLAHSSAVGVALMHAMSAVLTSAGFRVEETRDEYRPHQLRILNGPPPGQPPVWSFRDDELTLSGWQDAPTSDTD
ncbi:hypothetical protein ABZT17_21305 [Streptomyces sp. NPDC005648]|uniref:hypothetical protein n=1 Tax=Streptomyces sp. NPDC005648 TaxID=3157044 RepID=UPI0033B397A3